MKALVAAALIAFAPAAWAQATVAQLYQYAVQLGNLANAQNARISALEAKVAALEARQADAEPKIATLKSDLGLVIGRFDVTLRMLLIHACEANRLMAANNWAATLAGMKPFSTGNHVCPPLPATYYVPTYLSPGGPSIPPPAGG